MNKSNPKPKCFRGVMTRMCFEPTVTTFKYVEGGREHDAPEVVWNISSIRIFKCSYRSSIPQLGHAAWPEVETGTFGGRSGRSGVPSTDKKGNWEWKGQTVTCSMKTDLYLTLQLPWCVIQCFMFVVLSLLVGSLLFLLSYTSPFWWYCIMIYYDILLIDILYDVL